MQQKMQNIFSLFQLTRHDILGKFISYDISGWNYSTSIFGHMVKFGCSVRLSGERNLAVQFLFIRPFGFGTKYRAGTVDRIRRTESMKNRRTELLTEGPNK